MDGIGWFTKSLGSGEDGLAVTAWRSAWLEGRTGVALPILVHPWLGGLNASPRVRTFGVRSLGSICVLQVRVGDAWLSISKRRPLADGGTRDGAMDGGTNTGCLSSFCELVRRLFICMS